jgi:ATP-binding cassette subfamily B (MDR/TAP) protein 1
MGLIGLNNRFSGYSLAFYYGAILLEQGQITAGDVINVFFAVLIGAFSLGHIAPDIQTYMNATASGQVILGTIDRFPLIDGMSSEGKTIPQDKLHGRIVIKDIDVFFNLYTCVQFNLNF